MKINIITINDFFNFYKNYTWDKDIDNMINLYDENVIIFDTWDKGFINGIEEWSAIITDWLTSLGEEKVNVTFEEISIQEDEGKIGFASAIIQYQAISKDNNILRSMKNRISIGFVQKQGIWKVTHQHISVPIDSNLKPIFTI